MLPPFLAGAVIAPMLLAIVVLILFMLARKLPSGASAKDFLMLKLFGGPAYLAGYLSGIFFGKRKP